MRVVVADDDLLLREGLASLLDRSGFHVVGQAGNGVELLALVHADRFDTASLVCAVAATIILLWFAYRDVALDRLARRQQARKQGLTDRRGVRRITTANR